MASFTERLHTTAKFRLREFQLKTEKEKKSGKVKTDEEKRADETFFHENKQLLKMLIYGAKAVTTQLFINWTPSPESKKDFGPTERALYIKFGKNALLAFDLYLLQPSSPNYPGDSREKELKETLDPFAQTFLCLPMPAFMDVMEELMQFIVERMQVKNLTLI